MMEAMTTYCMAIQMQIGLEVSQTGKAHKVYAMSSWFSRKQSSVSLRTTKAEYIANFSAKL